MSVVEGEDRDRCCVLARSLAASLAHLLAAVCAAVVEFRGAAAVRCRLRMPLDADGLMGSDRRDDDDDETHTPPRTDGESTEPDTAAASVSDTSMWLAERRGDDTGSADAAAAAEDGGKCIGTATGRFAAVCAIGAMRGITGSAATDEEPEAGGRTGTGTAAVEWVGDAALTPTPLAVALAVLAMGAVSLRACDARRASRDADWCRIGLEAGLTPLNDDRPPSSGIDALAPTPRIEARPAAAA